MVCDKVDNVYLILGFLIDEVLVDWLGVVDMVVVFFLDILMLGLVLLVMIEGKVLLLLELLKVFDCVLDEGVLFYRDEDDMVK